MASAAVEFEKTCSFNNEQASDDQTCSTTNCKEEEEKKGRRGRSDAKCELVGFDSLPEYLKDNEFILDYYRSEWPLKETVLSVFSVHNETVNIWTHLVGFFIFLTLAVFAVAVFSDVDQAAGLRPVQSAANASTLQSEYNVGYSVRVLFVESSLGELGRSSAGVARWPFFAYLAGAMTCLLASAACHLLMCHSERCAYKMLRLDYAGISTLIVTSFYPLVYYTFICHPSIRNLYIGFITVFGVAAVLASLLPAFQTPELRPVRSLLFACMGVSGLVPILHKVVVFGDRPEAKATAWYEMVMGLCYGAGVVIYAARVPERWLPGKFDLVGHSHQLFHVLVVAGAYTHYLAGLEYLRWREVDVCLS